MQLIKPTVELWPSPEVWQEQVARAARLCYASEGGQKSAEDFCDMLLKRKHLSMFRHGSAYFVFAVKGEPDNSVFPLWLITALNNTPYVCIRYHKDKKKKERTFFVSTNRHFLMDAKAIAKELKPYEVTLQDFVAKAKELNFPTAFALIRYTVCVTTQISTSRELNRTSPNNRHDMSTLASVVASPSVCRIGMSVRTGRRSCWRVLVGRCRNGAICWASVWDCQHRMRVGSSVSMPLPVWLTLTMCLSGAISCVCV